MPKNSKSPSDIQKKRGWPKNFTNVADRITIKAPPLMRDFFEGGPTRKKSAESPELDFTPFPYPALIQDFCGGSHKKKKKSAESPELDFTPFPCPALIRDFCGGSQQKKVGGVTGIGLHAVSMSSLDSRLLWEGGPTKKKKSRRSHRNWTSRCFPHHSSAKDN
ncbi:hypothetical protein TNCV_1771841 [Trichonephila clavipes]|nr:hypothetical protein TNCV_1771841 [Trichonephila clavipes]